MSSFNYDKDCIQKFYDNHPFANTSFKDWQDAAKKPVNERIITLSKEAKEYLILDGLLWGFPYEKVSAATDAQLLTDAQKALQELPVELRKFIDDRFYGFLLVSGVGWTGYSPVINEVKGNPLKRGSVIIINADNIQGRTLNEWLAFKEKTAFDFFTDEGKSNKYELKMNFSIPGTQSTLADNLKQFLIHEAAHILAIGLPSVHPSFEVRDKLVPAKEFDIVWPDGTSGFPFLQTTWDKELANSPGEEPSYKMIPLLPEASNKIIAAKPVKYYGTDSSKKFTLTEAETLYKNLNKSCFPSLYSTVDYTEDFAETVTQYFMTYKDKYRFSIKLVELGASGKPKKVLARFKSPVWNRPECKYKLEYMKNLFGN